MKESILLFNFEQQKARKLAAQLMMAKFKVKVVKEEEWKYPIGCLCGWKDLTEEDEQDTLKEEFTLDASMLVMAGVDGNRLNQVLTAIKKAAIGKIPYKAIVTETNQNWLPKTLLEELKQEHEQMQSENSDKTMLHEK